jgi:phage protein D
MMGTTAEVTAKILVSVDDVEIGRPVFQKLLEAVVDQHVHLPGMFTLRFYDPDLELLDEGSINLAKSVRIETHTRGNEKVTLLQGEITSLEPQFGEGMIAELVVRGYDFSHRLYREMKSKAHINKKDSDLAGEIAQAAGLKAQVDNTQTVYDHVYQHNQSDLAFLMQRAWRIGYECYIEDDTLYFRKPPAAEAGVTLTWGDDLISFSPRMTLAEQVDEVLVRGWNVEKKAAIIGKAANGRLYPKIGEDKEGAAWARAFGKGKRVVVDQPVVSQAEADLLAAARLDELSGAFVQAEGLVYRRPEIRAGRFVRLEGLGQRLSGDYLVTRATHVDSAEGMFTTFQVTGSRTGLLLEQLSAATSPDRWPGVVTALVTNSDDPKGWGRVKVKYPWLAEDVESNWARVIGIGAGAEAGFFVLPAVGDEVLVTFAHGDFDQPYVLGGLWNGMDKPPPEVMNVRQGEMPLVRSWHSRGGHWLAMFDNADRKIEITTGGGHRLTFDDASQKIVMSSNDGQIIILDDRSGKITVLGKSELELKSNGNLRIQASKNLDIQANGQVNIKGATVNLN